ncbi:hypothetical protein [Candidatus Parabeggiatoa sp. HSG14]|uniref:hypothetical protein n=1 Tax=Candidatus Parabeggiatoa sp. HSG14 TaxID=3055593 RepID=UPI0025A69C73|nr:hypothetical protein [Thiotrichales bacterium HSG14]
MERPVERGFLSWFQTIFGIPLSPEKEEEPSPSPQPKPPPPVIVITPPTLEPVHPDTTFSKNNQTMLKQLQEAYRYQAIIEDAARRYPFLRPSILCGIGSRESHWGLALKPPGPGGRGDFARRRPRGKRRTPIPPDGGGYGRGLMQIDYDWHNFARTNKWKNPRENVMYACVVLNNARKFFRQRGVNLSDEQMLRAIIAAYNGGATATLKAIRAGQDIDANTTGKDYSKDVLNRSAWFEWHGWR